MSQRDQGHNRTLVTFLAIASFVCLLVPLSGAPEPQTNPGYDHGAARKANTYTKAETDALSYMQYLGVVDLSATYTLTIDDKAKLLRMSVASTGLDLAQSIILPASDSAAFTPGSMIHFQRAGVGEVPIIGAAGVTVQSTASPSATPWMHMRHSGATAVYLGSDTYWVTGHLKDSPL